MANLNVIDFNEKKKKLKEKEYAEAYAWATEEQKRNGFIMQPIRLIIENDHLEKTPDDFYISLFHDEETKTTIFRRDWNGGTIVQYNIITNYEELTKTAPSSILTLLDNGVKLANGRQSIA